MPGDAVSLRRTGLSLFVFLLTAVVGCASAIALYNEEIARRATFRRAKSSPA